MLILEAPNQYSRKLYLEVLLELRTRNKLTEAEEEKDKEGDDFNLDISEPSVPKAKQRLLDRILNGDTSMFQGKIFTLSFWLTKAYVAIPAVFIAAYKTFGLFKSVTVIEKFVRLGLKGMPRESKKWLYKRKHLFEFLEGTERKLGRKGIKVAGLITLIAFVIVGLGTGFFKWTIKMLWTMIKKGPGAIAKFCKWLFVWVGQVLGFGKKKEDTTDEETPNQESKEYYLKNKKGKLLEHMKLLEAKDIDSIIDEIESMDPISEDTIEKEIKNKYAIKNRFKSAIKIVIYGLTTKVLYDIITTLSDNRELSNMFIVGVREFDKISVGDRNDISADVRRSMANVSKSPWIHRLIIIFAVLLLVFGSLAGTYILQFLKGKYKGYEDNFLRAILNKFRQSIGLVREGSL